MKAIWFKCFVTVLKILIIADLFDIHEIMLGVWNSVTSSRSERLRKIFCSECEWGCLLQAALSRLPSWLSMGVRCSASCFAWSDSRRSAGNKHFRGLFRDVAASRISPHLQRCRWRQNRTLHHWTLSSCWSRHFDVVVELLFAKQCSCDWIVCSVAEWSMNKIDDFRKINCGLVVCEGVE